VFTLAAISTDRFFALLPYIVPLLLVEIGLIVYSLIDLFKAERRVRGNNKLVWALVILFIGTLGPLAYLFFGRKDM
jgi:hypothetical protein